MALAILRLSRTPGGGGPAFDIELGSNGFFQYAIGDESVERDRGFPVLGAPRFTSPVLGPLPEHARGRTRIEIPVRHFDREHRSVQLMSFRTPAREGPAVSDIVKVPIVARAEPDLPPIAFSTRHDMNGPTPPVVHASWAPAVPMRYRAVRPMSSALFLGSLVPVLSGLASKVLPRIGDLLASKGGSASPLSGLIQAVSGLLASKNGKTAGAAPAPVVDNLLKPETVQLITQLLQQLQGAPAAGTAPAGGTAATGGNAGTATPVAAPTPASGAKALSYRARPVPQRYARAADYAHATVAPALLTALPALMPLLEKVLTPETVKAVLEHADPTKVIGAVTDSVKEIGKLGLDFDKQSNEHLRALNPMGVHAPVDELLKGMGFASAMGAGVTREKGEPAYRRLESVTLGFAAASPVMIHGRSRICYRAGQAVAFPLDVTTPRPIADATLTCLVKDPATRKILVRKTFTIPQASSGRLPIRVALSSDDTAKLTAGEEFLVCAYLVWKNKKGARIGTSRTQLVTLVGEYTFDRVEDGTVVPLNDVAKFRPFWHKVWQGSFSKDLFKVELDGRYYFVLEPASDRNAPIVTSTRTVKGGDRLQRTQLKSGMTTGVAILNGLIPQISTGRPLPEPQLAALRASDFVARFHTVARFNAALSGRPDTTAALWMYPEVKLHQVVLLKAAASDADGHVRELVEERVTFPIPVLMHVIGARSRK